MSLNQESGSTTDKKSFIRKVIKKWQTWICVGVIVLAALILTIVLLKKPKDSNNAQEKIKGFNSEEVERGSETETIADKTPVEYDEYCVNYNNIVDKYNKAIKDYNGLLTELSEYEFLELPKAYPEEIHMKSFDENVEWNRTEYDGRKAKMENVVEHIDDYYEQLAINAYNCIIDEFNLLAEYYNEAVQVVAVDFIKGMPKNVEPKTRIEELTGTMSIGPSFFHTAIDEEIKNNEELAVALEIVLQITNPTEEWVCERLKTIDEVLDVQAVTIEKDPNQMLGKEFGYTACIYFSGKSIDQNSVKGNDVVDKGTDCGGAIEVYANREDALNRCDYLSEFDGTLLYSGSYAIIGTMVVRTSYKYSDQKQIELTDSIVNAFTIITDEE